MNVYIVKPIVFMPYAATGEFACIGVVLYSVEEGVFRYHVCKRDDLERVKARVHGFFPELPEEIFAKAVTYIKTELRRVDKGIRQNDLFLSVEDLITNLCRPRENIIRFGESRVLFCKDINEELKRQYERMVLRGFIDSEGLFISEMKKTIKEKIVKARLKCDFDFRVTAQYSYDLTIPFYFGEMKHPCALKPLDLRKEKPKAVVERMVQWQYDAGIINEKIKDIDIMCPTRFPEHGTEAYEAAWDMINKGRNLFSCEEYSMATLERYLAGVRSPKL